MVQQRNQAIFQFSKTGKTPGDVEKDAAAVQSMATVKTVQASYVQLCNYIWMPPPREYSTYGRTVISHAHWKSKMQQRRKRIAFQSADAVDYLLMM